MNTQAQHTASDTRADRHGSAVVSLPAPTQILITRRFDAPAALLFAAMTQPHHVRNWWGFETMPLTVCEIDLRVGGAWRYVTALPDGTELGWHGEYRDIVAPHRIVSTEVFEGFPDAMSVNTMTLTEADGVTTLQTLVEHSSQANRDGHIDSGMEGGMQHTFNRLDDLTQRLNTVAERYRNVAAGFTAVVAGVADDAWANPTPCSGWVARDVVRHLVEWVPQLLAAGAGVQFGDVPPVDDSPLAAWTALDTAIQAILDAPDTTTRQFVHPQAGTHTLDQAIGMFVLGDVLVHTWDLARATGQDETLDADAVHRMREGLEQMGDVLGSSGHYESWKPVADGADEQTRLLALTGRTA